MAEQNRSSKYRSSKLGLGMVIGVVAGAIAGLFLAPKTGKKMRADVLKRAKEIRKKLEDTNVDERVKEIFTDVTEKTLEIYSTAKDLLSEKLAEVTDTVTTIDKEKYINIVNEVVNTVKKDKEVAQDTLIKLKNYLEEDYTKLKPITPTKKVVKKNSTKRTTKKV